jgi:hypothetical protein
MQADIEYLGHNSRIFFVRFGGHTVICVSRGEAIVYCRAHRLVPHFVN